MEFTPKDRTQLEQARRAVEELEAKEQFAISAVTNALWAAGLRVNGTDATWGDIARRHAKAIRDALEPFDDGMRDAAAGG